MNRLSKKKGVVIIMMIVAALLLTGCGQKGDETNASNTATPAPTSEVMEVIEETATVIPATEEATIAPTVEPTEEPTEIPTEVPTETPAAVQTVQPTEVSAPEATATPAEDVVEVSTETATPAAPKEPSSGMFDPWYSVQTSIAYSSGTDSDWSYGNQRKEFTVTKPCYVRIGSSIVADWHWGWRYGEGKAITITYRFTGVQNCNIEVADGFVTLVESDDPNVLVFTRTLTAKGAHEEDVVVFRYDPLQVGSVSLEVIYDDNIKSQYDERNTVYFIEEEW